MRFIIGLALAFAPVPALAAQPGHEMSYVLMTGDDSSIMVSGSTDDMNHAAALRAGNAPMLYVRHGGTAYVIRDPAMIGRAKEIMRPQQELGARQGELGRQQGDLGRRQAELGTEQGRLGRLMADLPPSRMGELSAQQGELGRRQSELGRQQAALGSRQAELGNQQAALGRAAQPKLSALVDDAVRRGLAQRVN